MACAIKKIKRKGRKMKESQSIEGRLDRIEKLLTIHFGTDFSAPPAKAESRDDPNAVASTNGAAFSGGVDGETDFYWPRAISDSVQTLVHVKVDRPPSEDNVTAYKDWLRQYLPVEAGRDVKDGMQTGTRQSDWQQAKNLAYFNVTKYVSPALSEATVRGDFQGSG